MDIPKEQWPLLTEMIRRRLSGQRDLSRKEARLAKVEVFGRLIAPMSENATVDWVKRTAFCDIPGNEGISVKRDGLYRVSDKLLEGKEKIEEALRQKTKGLFRLEETIYLYDLTSSYFEGEAEGNSKARYGYSRDGRGDRKQVVVGLLVDEEGFVKGHEIYEDDTTDITSLKGTVERLKERLRDKGACSQQSWWVAAWCQRRILKQSRGRG